MASTALYRVDIDGLDAHSKYCFTFYTHGRVLTPIEVDTLPSPGSSPSPGPGAVPSPATATAAFSTPEGPPDVAAAVRRNHVDHPYHMDPPLSHFHPGGGGGGPNYRGGNGGGHNGNYGSGGGGGIEGGYISCVLPCSFPARSISTLLESLPGPVDSIVYSNSLCSIEKMIASSLIYLSNSWRGSPEEQSSAFASAVDSQYFVEWRGALKDLYERCGMESGALELSQHLGN